MSCVTPSDVYSTIELLVDDLSSFVSLPVGSERIYVASHAYDMRLSLISRNDEPNNPSAVLAIAQGWLRPDKTMLLNPSLEVRLFLGEQEAEALSYMDEGQPHAVYYRSVYDELGRLVSDSYRDNLNAYLVKWLRHSSGLGYRVLTSYGVT
jgi:hypothetical protein